MPHLDSGGDAGEVVQVFETLLVAMFGVFVAALLRGFTGFGFGLAAVPLLSLALPPAKVVPLVVVLQFIVGTGGLRGAWRLCDWRAVGGLVPGTALGIPIGVAILAAFHANHVRLAIGCLILGSVLLLWRGFRLPPKPPAILAIMIGFSGGIISGLASMGGPPIVAYLMALSLRPLVVRSSIIIYFMATSIMSLLMMLWRGLIDQEIMLWSLVSVPLLIAGSSVGTWGFKRSKPQHHHITALMTLTVLAVLLIVRALRE